MAVAKANNRVVGRMVRCELGEHEDAQIMVMGDLHVGDPNCDLEMIRESVAWLMDAPNRYAVIVGDLFNAALKDSVSDVYGEAMTVKESRKMLVRLLSPAIGRILSVVSGNHDHRVRKAVGDDIAEITCIEAGIPYHDSQAFLDISLGKWQHMASNPKPQPVHYALYATHGFGGGRMVGGKANNLLRLGDIVSADIYCSGHTHTPLVIPQVRWEANLRSGNIVEASRLFVATGASLDRGNGYAVRFGFPALPKLWPIITISGRAKHMSATV